MVRRTFVVNDGYKTYFAEKLWEMIPGVYRYEDAQGQNAGALRAFVELLAEQAAILRRSHDRLWDDQFIELCDDWAVPYLGDLVGTRLLSALNPRGRRVDVAKTIYYRRRKGTLAVLEELISDITGWEGAVKENFRRLGRAWHRLDPPPTAHANSLSKTLPGGWADLRTVWAAELTNGPFDEFHHTPDMRRHRGGDAVDGRYGIPKLAFHLYRLQSYRVTSVHPHLVQGTTGYSVDPSGRDIPLFMPGNRLQDPTRDITASADWARWLPALEWELPAPMRCRILAHNKTALLPQALRVESGPGNAIPSKSTVAANLASWQLNAPTMKLAVDPERGRLLFIGGAPQAGAGGDYHYGFSGPIGAGTYARPEVEQRTPDNRINKGGALSAVNMVLDKGITQIDDSATYGPVVNIPAVKDITLQAANYERSYLRLASNWKITSGIKDACVLLDGLWIGAGKDTDGGLEMILSGNYENVILRHVTLDPGGRQTQDSGSDSLPAVTLVVEGHVETLRVESCITGPIKTRGNGAIESVRIRDSILQSQKAKLPALELGKGTVTLERVTVFGKIDVHRLWATETLLTADADVTDIQTGCFRFGTAPETSRLPHPYESHWIDDANYLFTSRRFGDPGFGQLSSAAPKELHRGAENGSEIGAFSTLLNPIKLDSLMTKTEEYMPFGLVPIYIEET
jgi:hypothetical protein